MARKPQGKNERARERESECRLVALSLLSWRAALLMLLDGEGSSSFGSSFDAPKFWMVSRFRSSEVAGIRGFGLDCLSK